MHAITNQTKTIDPLSEMDNSVGNLVNCFMVSLMQLHLEWHRKGSGSVSCVAHASTCFCSWFDNNLMKTVKCGQRPFTLSADRVEWMDNFILTRSTRGARKLLNGTLSLCVRKLGYQCCNDASRFLELFWCVVEPAESCEHFSSRPNIVSVRAEVLCYVYLLLHLLLAGKLWKHN